MDGPDASTPANDTPDTPDTPDDGTVSGEPDAAGAAPSADIAEPDVAKDAGPIATPDVAAPPEAPRLVLDPGIQASLATRVSRKKRLEARRLNGRGVKKHKRRAYTQAIELYLEAIAVDPRAGLARFNLACAYALTGKRTEALQQLLALHALKKGDKVADARIDRDFEPLWDDPDFKRVTGDAQVKVLPRRGVSRSAVSAFIGVLKKVPHFRATRIGTPPGLGTTSTVFARTGFEGPARILSELVDGAAVKPVPPELASAKGDVFILVAREDDIAGAAARELEGFVDAKLRGKRRGVIHQLKLKSTGFFEWTLYDDGGAGQTRRNGTWKADGDKLKLSYKERRDTDEGVGATEDKESSLSFAIAGSRITIGGVTFKR